MNTMSTLSLFTSQILLWNYLFLLALGEKKKIILIIAHRMFPLKNKTGGKDRGGELGGKGHGGGVVFT